MISLLNATKLKHEYAEHLINVKLIVSSNNLIKNSINKEYCNSGRLEINQRLLKLIPVVLITIYCFQYTALWSFMLSALFYSSQDEGNIFTSFCTIGLLIIWEDAYSQLPIKTGRMKNSSVTHSKGDIWTFSTTDVRTRNDTQLKLSYLARDIERWLKIWFWIQNWNGQ